MSGLLTHSPADVLRWLLIALGYGSDPVPVGGAVQGAWPIHAHNEPNEPDDLVTLYDTRGADTGREMVGGLRVEHHGIQARVRAAESTAGWIKANAIAVAFDSGISLRTVSISGSVYTVYAVTRKSGPVALGRGEAPATKRAIYTINAVIAMKQTN